MQDPLDRRTNPMQVANKETQVTPVERNSVVTFINNNVKPIVASLAIAAVGVLALAEEGLFVLPNWAKIIVGVVLLVAAALGIRPKKNKDGTVVIAGSPEDSNVINAKKNQE